VIKALGGRVAVGLTDRRAERDALDRLVDAVRSGESRTLVLRGDPGVGKSALLRYLIQQATGCRVARAAGVQSEMELAFAGLHQLCAPMLDRAGHLPAPQRDALRVALGLSAGPPPDRFLVGLAVLGLVSEVAAGEPLICVIDDEQWLDQASSQALGFAARRLAADSVGLVFAARPLDSELTGHRHDELAGLPELTVAGLREDHARALLDSVLPGPLDTQVRDLIVAETHGNPLALLELPRGLTPAELAGGFGLPGALPGAAALPGRIEESFRRQLAALPAATREFLLVAAADPSGDRALVARAAQRLGIPVQAAAAAQDAGLLELGARIRFRHPLLRSAAYRAASGPDRQAAHAALAAATNPATDPDRRAWHRAKGTAGADEEVAAELERSAGRAQARGGLAAAAAFGEQAMLLTADPAVRAERALTAARASLQAGAFAKTLDLLASAESGPLDESQSARADLLRGQVAFASGLGSDAPPLLLKAARRLEPLDLGLARETYLTAWMAGLFAGRLACGADLMEICRAARAMPRAGALSHAQVVLDALAELVTDGPAAAAPKLHAVISMFTGSGRGSLTTAEELRWGWLAQAAASALWDDDTWRVMLAREVRLARDAGALDYLPVTLGALGTAVVWGGDFATAETLITESDAVCAATGTRAAPFTAMMLTAWRGAETEAMELVTATLADATAAGQGIAVTFAHWVSATLNNSLGRYNTALAAAQQARDDIPGNYVSMWALPELIEAAVRSGQPGLARLALTQLAGLTRAGGTDFGLGIEARCRALVSPAAVAEPHYAEAITRLGRTQLRPELARAHLLYGEWLRRGNRRLDARHQLHAAHQLFTEIGADAFTERARRELLATGEKVRKREADTYSQLTSQEEHIVRLARDGRTNPEIAAELFISTRTVEWHLRKVFAKLGITSRRDLHTALPPRGQQPPG
jgi:DNA-binding CsgD family transcriptional regulator